MAKSFIVKDMEDLSTRDMEALTVTGLGPEVKDKMTEAGAKRCANRLHLAQEEVPRDRGQYGAQGEEPGAGKEVGNVPSPHEVSS